MICKTEIYRVGFFVSFNNCTLTANPLQLIHYIEKNYASNMDNNIPCHMKMHFLGGYVSQQEDQIQQQMILAQTQVYKLNHAVSNIGKY